MQIHNMSWFFPSHHLSFWQQNVARYYFHKILKSIQRNVDFGLRCTFVQRMCQCQRSAILLLISRNSIHYFALFSTFLEHCQLQSFLAAHFYSASHGIIDCWKKDPFTSIQYICGGEEQYRLLSPAVQPPIANVCNGSFLGQVQFIKVTD